MGKISPNEQNVKLKNGSRKITNRQDVAEIFSWYFSKVVEILLKQNDNWNSSCTVPQQKINSCNETMFIIPVTETEAQKWHKSLKVNCWQVLI
jgi:uncharacterized protein YrrD